MGYEISKVLCSRIIIIALAASSCFGFYYSYKIIKNRSYWNGKTVYADIAEYSACLGEYTEEKHNFLKEKTEELEKSYNESGYEHTLMEMFEYQALLSSAEKCREVIEYHEGIKRNSELIADSETGYYRLLNRKINKMYKEMPDVRIGIYSALQDVTTVFETSEVVDVAFIAVLILFSCYLFLNEHKCGTYYMVKSSYRGNGKVYRDKMCAAFLFTVLTAFLQVFSMVSFMLLKGGFDEWKTAIQMEKLFVHSPYNYSVFQMVLAVFAIKALAYLALMCCFICVSLLFSKNIIPLALNTLIGLGGLFASYVVSGKFFVVAGGRQGQLGAYPFMKKFLAFPLIHEGVKYLKDCEMVNVLGYPVRLLTIAAASNVVIVSLGAAVGYIIYKENFRKAGVK